MRHRLTASLRDPFTIGYIVGWTLRVSLLCAVGYLIAQS